MQTTNKAEQRILDTHSKVFNMTRHDLSLYYNRHCRLKLKSGKEVFGVIWEHDSDEDKLYFASHGDHKAYRQTIALQQPARNHRWAQVVNADDIIAAESLQ
ncbi:MAG: hypothetical protein EA392_06705 [Cryomorphaceae bacterium]|nr:MAG: hypothetical protein EA392_06705 [Cryomorphaceae bacterium]